MKISFEQILKRIAIIERDISELNKIKAKLPEDRTFSPGLQLVFDKQINALIAEKSRLLGIGIPNPPDWLSRNGLYLNGHAKLEKIETIPDDKSPSFSTYETEEQEVFNFIKAIPKTEIHLHLEACLNKQTLRKLLEKNKISISDADFEAKFNFHDLNGFIQLFFFIQSAIKSPEDFSFMADSLANYLRSDNIIYAEVFVAPSRFIQSGIDFYAMIDTLVNRLRDIEREDGTQARLLIDISRTFGVENAMNNLKRVIQLKHKEVIGIGFGGAELLGPAKDFGDVFKAARDAGLHCVVHAGEDDGPWSIWDSLKVLKAERIGHGTSAIQDPRLLEYLKEKQIPIEICLTSNVFTGKYVRKEEHHPVRAYYDMGILTCINTDDPEIFNVNLTYEYFKLYRFLGFNLDEIVDLVKKGVYSSFHPNKDELWERIQDQIVQLRLQHSLV